MILLLITSDCGFWLMRLVLTWRMKPKMTSPGQKGNQVLIQSDRLTFSNVKDALAPISLALSWCPGCRLNASFSCGCSFKIGYGLLTDYYGVALCERCPRDSTTPLLQGNFCCRTSNFNGIVTPANVEIGYGLLVLLFLVGLWRDGNVPVLLFLSRKWWECISLGWC